MKRAITLKDGMAQFNSEAIEPITKLVDSDAQTAVDTIKAVVKASGIQFILRQVR